MGAVLMCGDVGAVVMWDDGWGDSGCSDDVGCSGDVGL